LRYISDMAQTISNR